jgi:hypothetical protein
MSERVDQLPGKIRTSSKTNTDSEGQIDQMHANQTKVNNHQAKQAAFKQLLSLQVAKQKLAKSPNQKDEFHLGRIVKRTGDEHTKWPNESKDVWQSLQHIHSELETRTLKTLLEHVDRDMLLHSEKLDLQKLLPVISQFIQLAIGCTHPNFDKKTLYAYRLVKDIYKMAKISVIIHNLSDKELQLWDPAHEHEQLTREEVLKMKQTGLYEISDDSDEVEGETRNHFCNEQLIDKP